MTPYQRTLLLKLGRDGPKIVSPGREMNTLVALQQEGLVEMSTTRDKYKFTITEAGRAAAAT